MLITTVTKQREPFFAESANACEAIESFYRVQEQYPFFLYAFVIMPDHCHFFLRMPPPLTISGLMNRYKSGLTFDLGIKQLWQSRFHIRIVKNSSAVIRYIHTNPVKAGLADSPENFLWSSAAGRWDVTAL